MGDWDGDPWKGILYFILCRMAFWSAEASASIGNEGWADASKL